ncbi:MAG: septum formation initiator family protein [Synergistaceae bacterium]|jgi:cell division protein FtsB|nr:septum formation initiator family protein [Synergistaceae bacterium]
MPKLRWVIIYAVTTFIMAVTVATFFREVGRIERLSDELELRMGELVELTRKNQELQEKISYYTTPAGMAFLAREEFNLVRPGEKIYRIEIVSEDMLRKEE